MHGIVIGHLGLLFKLSFTLSIYRWLSSSQKLFAMIYPWLSKCKSQGCALKRSSFFVVFLSGVTSQPSWAIVLPEKWNFWPFRQVNNNNNNSFFTTTTTKTCIWDSQTLSSCGAVFLLLDALHRASARAVQIPSLTNHEITTASKLWVQWPTYKGSSATSQVLPLSWKSVEVELLPWPKKNKKRPLRLCINSEHSSYAWISKNQARLRFGAVMREVAASRATVPILWYRYCVIRAVFWFSAWSKWPFFFFFFFFCQGSITFLSVHFSFFLFLRCLFSDHAVRLPPPVLLIRCFEATPWQRRSSTKWWKSLAARIFG